MFSCYLLSTNKINVNTAILLPPYYLEEWVSIQQGIKLEFAYTNALYIFFLINRTHLYSLTRKKEKQ